MLFTSCKETKVEPFTPHFMPAANTFPPPEKSQVRMTIQVDGLERINSTCTISLYHDAEEFNQLDKATLRNTVSAINGIVKWDVAHLATGRFAVAVFEDSNGDGMQNQQERLGFSNNPNVTLGIPKFEDVAVTVSANNAIPVSIHLRTPLIDKK